MCVALISGRCKPITYFPPGITYVCCKHYQRHVTEHYSTHASRIRLGEGEEGERGPRSCTWTGS